MAIVSLIALPFLIRGEIYNVRQSNAWDLRNKMYTALREAEKSPPGLERAGKYLARLKAIDNPYAPDDLKQALADYIAALNQIVQAGKAGGDTTPFDQQMEAARLRIAALEKRYDEYK